jgi:hypothetical protein
MRGKKEDRKWWEVTVRIQDYGETILYIKMDG